MVHQPQVSGYEGPLRPRLADGFNILDTRLDTVI